MLCINAACQQWLQMDLTPVASELLTEHPKKNHFWAKVSILCPLKFFFKKNKTEPPLISRRYADVKKVYLFS